MPSILIIDDNPLNAELAQYVLSTAGMEVQCAGSAAEGFERLRSALPDLILMDVQMPDMDGLEMTRRLRADPALASIRIVALTAYAMKGDEQRILAAGCDGYLAKPIQVRTFADTIRSFLPPPAP